MAQLSTSHEEFLTGMARIVVPPVDEVAVMSKIIDEVPSGNVPEIVLEEASKVAHEGIESVPESMAEYVTGRHGVV